MISSKALVLSKVLEHGIWPLSDDVVIRHTIEMHSSMLSHAINDYFTHGSKRRQQIVSAIGLSENADFVDVLMNISQKSKRGESNQALRSLGQIGGRVATEYLIGYCVKGESLSDNTLYHSAVSGLVLASSSESFYCLKGLYEKMNMVSPEEDTFETKLLIALGLGRLGFEGAAVYIKECILGKYGVDAQAQTIRNIERISPDATFVVEELCSTFLTGSVGISRYAFATLQVMTGCQPLYQPIARNSTLYDPKKAAEDVKHILYQALYSENKEISARSAILLGALGVVETVDILLNESRTNNYGFSDDAINILLHGNFWSLPDVRTFFENQTLGNVNDVETMSFIQMAILCAHVKLRNENAQNFCLELVQRVSFAHDAIIKNASSSFAYRHIETPLIHQLVAVTMFQRYLIEVLPVETVCGNRELIWQLIFSSRRDVRQRCIEALISYCYDTERTALTQYMTHEPSTYIRSMILHREQAI